MVLTSFAEIISIGAVLPFLAVLTEPTQVFQHQALQPYIHRMGFSAPAQLLLPLTVAFAVAAIAAGALRLILLWATTRLAFETGADLGISIYRRTLFQPYAVHVARNSSEVINGISTKASAVIHGVIGPILTLISAGILLTAIFSALLSIQPLISLVACCGFGLIYGSIIWITRARQVNNSERISKESTQVIKSLQEGLGGIRDVLIDGSQEAYCKIYRNADLPLRQAQGTNLFMAQSPRYGMEALGMVLMCILAYSLARKSDGLEPVIPTLGALAVGAQRLLPVMQQLYAAWSSIQGSHASLRDTLELLQQPLPEYADQPAPVPLSFKHHIRLHQVSFRYGSGTQWVLKNLSLSINKGGRIGFIGTTGSGKSTLLDIVMGLLEPTDGHLEIDGQLITPTNHRAWQAHIAHVPQAIFLADSTIEENIAFGQPRDRIDRDRVRLAARQAQIAETIESLPKQYQTYVGERGIRLSGGQRQRIGIARALYKRADVIIFDEATSALDNETEQAVMQAIDFLRGDLTVLIVAHRLSTLANCTQIVELHEGRIRRIGSYAEVISQSP